MLDPHRNPLLCLPPFTKWSTRQMCKMYFISRLAALRKLIFPQSQHFDNNNNINHIILQDKTDNENCSGSQKQYDLHTENRDDSDKTPKLTVSADLMLLQCRNINRRSSHYTDSWIPAGWTSLQLMWNWWRGLNLHTAASIGWSLCIPLSHHLWEER